MEDKKEIKKDDVSQLMGGDPFKILEVGECRVIKAKFGFGDNTQMKQKIRICRPEENKVSGKMSMDMDGNEEDITFEWEMEKE